MKNIYTIAIIAAIITALWKVVEGAVSYREGTFSLRQLLDYKVAVKFHGRYRWQHLPMSFLNNWAVSWGDIFLFSIFNALVVPHLWPMSGWYWKYPVFFLISIIVTWLEHRSWWLELRTNEGHIILRDYKAGYHHKYWMRHVTNAGRVHFWFMVAQLAIVLMYVFTPMPRETLYWGSLWLTYFVIIQQLQAHYIQRGNPMRSLFNMMWQIVFIWMVAAFKL